MRNAGLKQRDFASEGAILPSQHRKRAPSFVYDTIVVGVGYAGLSAGRDLAVAGRSSLLLEARDRVGGRTYTVNEDGFKFDMGGAWFNYHNPNALRELIRYNLDRDLTVTSNLGFENNYFSLKLHGKPRIDMSQEKAAELSASGTNS